MERALKAVGDAQYELVTSRKKTAHLWRRAAYITEPSALISAAVQKGTILIMSLSFDPDDAVHPETHQLTLEQFMNTSECEELLNLDPETQITRKTYRRTKLPVHAVLVRLRDHDGLYKQQSRHLFP